MTVKIEIALLFVLIIILSFFAGTQVGTKEVHFIPCPPPQQESKLYARL